MIHRYYLRTALLPLLCAGAALMALTGCSKTAPSDTASANATSKPAANAPHAADGRPATDEIQARMQKVQSDPNLSPEAKELLTKQMQSATRDPRAAGH